MVKPLLTEELEVEHKSGIPRLILGTIIIVALLAAAAYVGVTSIEDQNLPKGQVVGQVIVGPLCPVEPCGRTLDMSNYSLSFIDQLGFAHRISLQVNGSFNTILPIGSYRIYMYNSCPWLGCSRTFPVTTLVREGITITITINIDTSIR